jgi:RES domain-containing protein
LEMLVHLDNSDILKNYRLIPITFAESLVRDPAPNALPPHWNRHPAPASVRTIGDGWIINQSSVVLRVPSVIVPDESNFLINVQHPDFSKLTIGAPRHFRFDRRLR